MNNVFFVCLTIIIVSIVVVVTNFDNFNVPKNGLEQCPQFGAGHNGSIIWVKSCSEYTELIKNNK